MTQELEDALASKYPMLFRQRSLSMMETCMCWGLECGDGWYGLIEEMCRRLQYICDEFDVVVEFQQIKEKYGTLRVYYGVKYGPSWTVTTPWLYKLACWSQSHIRYLIFWKRTYKERSEYSTRVNRLIRFLDPYRKKINGSCYKSKYDVTPAATKVEDTINSITGTAENMSAIVCEACGSTVCVDVSGRSWITTRCKACREKEKGT